MQVKAANPLNYPAKTSILFLKLMVVAGLTCGKGWAASPYQHRRFTKVSRCPGRVLSPAAGYQRVMTRSVLECVSLCGPRTACVSIVFDVDSNDCQLTSTRVSHNCSNTVPASNVYKSYEKPPGVVCENGGTLSADGQWCTCPQGYYGNTCNITVADCEDCADKGFLLNPGEGVFFVHPPNFNSVFPVYCEAKPSFLRTSVAIRLDPKVSFNLSWHDYRKGFGDIFTQQAYWLGLERTHQLTTNRQYRLQFKYHDFILGSEASGYAIGFHAPVKEEKLGDCLSDLRGAPFSTYDKDDDGSSTVHCAKQHGAGWWFKGDTCSSCNPFGPILSSPEVTEGVKGQSFWKRNLGNLAPRNLRVFLIAKNQ
ncbi:hypothetical protein ACOMHN_061748 [Nucella lapillus]